MKWFEDQRWVGEAEEIVELISDIEKGEGRCKQESARVCRTIE